MPEGLPLEGDMIELLAAETRREILGLLQERRMTVTELSRELDLGKATVHEHLDKLTDAELVRRDEDDRLWVYYELSHRGERLLNPRRTRFYLALAGALVAALVAGLAVYGYMQVAGPEVEPTSQSRALEADPAVALADQEAYADEPVRLEARVNATDVDAFLVDEQAASRIREGDLGVRGLRLQPSTPSTDAGTAQARGNRTLLTSEASLGPGTYYLYVRTPEGDNAPSMPSVRLLGLEAEPDRRRWHRGLDPGPLVVTVTRDGAPANGTVRLGGADRESVRLTAPLADGRARFPARALDDLEPGDYRLGVRPADRDRWIDVEARLTVGDAPLGIHPLHVRGDAGPVHVEVGGPPRLREAPPSIRGAPGAVEATETGWRIALEPREPGTATVQLGRTEPATVQVHPSATLHATVREGPRVVWTVETPAGEPVPDAALRLDARGLGFTNDTGQLASDLPDEGSHRLAVGLPDGSTVHRALHVDGWRIQAPSPSLRVEPVTVNATGSRAQLGVRVANELGVPQPATATASLDGAVVDAQALEVPAGGTAGANLTVPADAGRQRITVAAPALDPVPFTYRNASGGDPSEEDSPANGTGGTDAATVEIGENATETDAEAADDLAAGDAAARVDPLEPIAPRELSDGADAPAAEAQETPAPGAGLLAALAGLAALLAARRPKP